MTKKTRNIIFFFSIMLIVAVFLFGYAMEDTIPDYIRMTIIIIIMYYCIVLYHYAVKPDKVKTIKRKGRPLFVTEVKVGDLNKDQCSPKFLKHQFPNDYIVNVKCHEDGTPDLRGKKLEYRIIVED